MLRYRTETTPGLVALYDIRPENERVYSYNPGARTGRRVTKMSWTLAVKTSVVVCSYFGFHYVTADCINSQ